MLTQRAIQYKQNESAKMTRPVNYSRVSQSIKSNQRLPPKLSFESPITWSIQTSNNKSVNRWLSFILIILYISSR